MEALNAKAIDYHKSEGGWPNNDILEEDNVRYLYKRISLSNLRYSETPSVGGKVSIAFGVWIIRPEKDVLLRVELV